MDIIQRYLTQLRTIWSGLSAAHRFVALAVAAAVILTTGAVYFVSVSTDYVALASGMAPEEAAATTAQLDAAAIPYRLEAGGSTVVVPKDRLAKARVELANKGIPARGGKGYELFDDVSLGATPFVQNVNYTRALQAELARSIMQLEPVAGARVMIARAEPSPFIREQQPTTASVVLKLKPGSGVSRSMAGGIVSLVARSVEGLRPENVTVVDSAGRLLSGGHGGEGGGASASDLERRRELEDYLSTKAEELLAKHLGAGRALVRVSADLTTQKTRETRETYSPEEKVVRSEQTVSTESGSSESARGVAGAAGNTGKNHVSTGGGGRSKEETTHTDYLVSKTTREMENRLGSVQRLTIAAMVDLSQREGTKVISAKEVEDLVKKAVGFQPARDEIAVTDVPLTGDAPAPEPAEPGWAERSQQYVNIARNAALVVAFLFLTGTVLLLARRLATVSTKAAAASASDPLRNGKAVGMNGMPAALTDRQRFVEIAAADPQHLARVLTVLLRNGSQP